MWWTEHPESPHGTVIGRKALSVAIQEAIAGAKEVGGNNLGPWVEKYHGHNPDYKGTAWCAPFVRWCFLQAGEAVLFQPDDKKDSSALAIYNQAREFGIQWDFDPTLALLHLPEPGDMVFWWRGEKKSWMGHIGFVYDYQGGVLRTIEGNRTPEVRGFEYDLHTVIGSHKLLGFARVPDVWV